jgi:cytochrome P450
MAHDSETLPRQIVDLTDPASFADDVPHEAFAEMMRLPGLYWQPTDIGTANGGFWAVTRFADILACERDIASFTNTRGGAWPVTNQDPQSPGVRSHIATSDPPVHTRLRGAAAAGFGPRVVANFEPWVREIVTEVLDAIEPLDRFDWVPEICQPIPALVMGRVLGTPRADRQRIVDLALASFAAVEDTAGLAPGEGTGRRTRAQNAEIIEYASRIREWKRAEPADDMFTELGRCLDRGEINEEEFYSWMIQMIAAGFETTHTAIGQMMRMYLEDPEVAALTDRALDEGLAARAVDEYLRLTTPAMQMARTARHDLVFAGERIRQDDVMVVYFIAANRDPAFYADPHRFDPWRKEKASMAFGSGIHRCIGPFLAKLELRVLLEELRARNMRFRLAGEPRRGSSIFINQLRALPVERVR